MTMPNLLPVPVRVCESELLNCQVGEIDSSVHDYLGARGIRMLEADDIWHKSILNTFKNVDLTQFIVVFPMVTSAAEIRRIRKRWGKNAMRIGVTVETPAAAIRIDELLEVVEYVQIGLNDLTQYTMAWNRDLPNEERLPSDRIVGPVEDLIASVVDACSDANIPYTLGLDLRPSFTIAKQLLGLGVQSLSCAALLTKYWREAFDATL